jgi:two-component system, cell cycle response regulator
MSVKVLLADESTTIKKAFQLALSEFSAEIKSVPSGLDVLSVSEEFKPDIVFADVLLTKKSGYEVCKELKNHTTLNTVPVILMWSSFMEFDTGLAESSGYTDKIEKPFDAQAIKDKISLYVNKAKNHPLLDMIQPAQLPDFEESDTIFRQKNLYAEIQKKKAEMTSSEKEVTQTKSGITSNLSAKKSNFEVTKNIPVIELNEVPSESYTPDEDPQEEFTFNTHQAVPQGSQKTGQSQNQNVPKSKDPFQIHLQTESYGDFEEVVLVKAEKQNQIDGLDKNLQNYLEGSPVSLQRSQQKKNQNAQKSESTQIDEQLIREEARLMAEKICWQIIPDITEKIVREELAKLMNQIEKSI